MLNWPDIHFPPVNLYSAPKATWPHMYLELEKEYCKEIEELFYKEKDPNWIAYYRSQVLPQREEFNRLWNARSREI